MFPRIFVFVQLQCYSSQCSYRSYEDKGLSSTWGAGFDRMSVAMDENQNTQMVLIATRFEVVLF